MRPVQILSSALLCSSVASAWSWSDMSLNEALGDLLTPHKRSPQRVTLGNTDASTPNPTDSTNDTSTAPPPSSSDQGQETGGDSGSAKPSRSGSGSGTSNRPTQTAFDPRLPPGGVAMITPNPRSSASYYKIGDYVTFAWNYTSLSVTPSAVDVLAFCSKNQQTYTIASNQTVGDATGAVTWDTKATATVPLLTETYTLIIHDAAKEASAPPSAGYLATFQQFTFGMYMPQPYQPLESYVCVTCSGAMSALEKQSLAVIAIFATFAILGATWFTGVAGFL